MFMYRMIAPINSTIILEKFSQPADKNGHVLLPGRFGKLESASKNTSINRKNKNTRNYHTLTDTGKLDT